MKDIKIHISGKEWLVKFNKNSSGSSFDTGTRIMSIGCKYVSDLKENLVHETLEAVLTEHNARYQQEVSKPENGDYLFCFNHKEFQNIARDYAAFLVELTELSREGK